MSWLPAVHFFLVGFLLRSLIERGLDGSPQWYVVVIFLATCANLAMGVYRISREGR